MTIPYWTLKFEVCIHVICLYNTGERSEPEKNDNNKIKQQLDPLFYPSSLYKRPHLWQISGGGSGPPVPPSGSALISDFTCARGAMYIDINMDIYKHYTTTFLLQKVSDQHKSDASWIKYWYKKHWNNKRHWMGNDLFSPKVNRALQKELKALDN